MNGERNPDDRGEAASAGCPRSSCLQLFVDGELDPTPASDLEAHLAACSTCADRAALLVATKASVRRVCAGRASDALRAKICLALTREVREGEPHHLDASSGVAADFVTATSPSRESLVHGDVSRGDLVRGDLVRGDLVRGDLVRADERRRTRVAYGVGALALAAGMALAVVGERAGDDERTADRSPSEDGARDGAEGDAARPAAAELAEGSRPVQTTRADGLGLPGGMPGAAPGRLVPVTPPPTMVGVDAPSLSPSAIAGRHLAAQVPDGRTTIDAVLDDLVAEHMNPLPPEENNEKRLSRFERSVGVAMRPPTFRKYDARFRGARLLPIRGAQRTAMLTYELPGGERVTVYLWNPQAVPIGATRLQPRMMREAREARGSADPVAEKAPIYVGEARGYSVAACERRGVGYALATQRDPDESVRMVAASLP